LFTRAAPAGGADFYLGQRMSTGRRDHPPEDDGGAGRRRRVTSRRLRLRRSRGQCTRNADDDACQHDGFNQQSAINFTIRT
jgi:hypothetical protein